MTTVAIASAGASPGVSALAMALGMARCRVGADGIVLIEADPAGGRLAPRFGLAADPSLATYVSDARRGSSVELVMRNSQRIGSLAALACPVDPELTRQVLARGGDDLALLVRDVGLDAVVDLGRLDEGSEALPFAVRADQVLLVTRPRFDEVQALLYRRRLLVDAGCTVGLVTIGDEPHHPDEVAGVVDLALLAALPDHAAVASAFGGGRFNERRLVRTRLWRTILDLADRLWSGAAVVAQEAAPSERDGSEQPVTPGGRRAAGAPPPWPATAVAAASIDVDDAARLDPVVDASRRVGPRPARRRRPLSAETGLGSQRNDG